MVVAFATPGLAQQAGPPPAQDASVVDDVIVTARSRSERLQDVPLAITSISGEQLKESGVRNIRDLAYQTPGLSIVSGGAEFAVTPVIRGVVSLGGGSGVSSFLDGVAVGDSASVNLSMLDIERVEVVKGPVAALYGQNAYAGAINFVSRKPGGPIHGDARATYSSGENLNLTGYVGGDVIADRLSAGLAVNFEDFGGIYDDGVNGNTAGGFTKKNARATFVYTPTDRLDFSGGVYYGNDSFDVTPLVYATNNCGPVSTNPVSTGEFTQYCGKLNFNELQVATIPSQAGVAGNQRESTFVNLRGNYDLGGADLTILYGHNNTSQSRFNDFTGRRNGVPFLLTNNTQRNLLQYFGNTNKNESSSYEARLTSKQDQAFRWTTGVYYSDNEGSAQTTIGIDGSRLLAGEVVAGTAGTYTTPTGAPSARTTITESEGKTFSAFVGVDYEFIRGVTASGEVRRAHSESTLDTIRSTAFPGVLRPLGLPVRTESDLTSYRVSLNYKLNDDAMLYASVGEGFKPGGNNQSASIAAERSFGPETNTTYELGAKLSGFNRRATLNIALFQVDTEDLQLQGISDDPTNTGLVTKNLGEAQSRGFEIETVLRPFTGVRINLGAAYADPKLGANTYSFSSAAACAAIPACAASQLVALPTPAGGTRNAQNLEDNQVPRTSKVQLVAGIQYDGRLTADWDWFARADFRYESKQYVAETNFSYYEARENINLRAGVERGPIRVTAFVNNVTDDQTPEQVLALTRLNDFNGNMSGYLPLPRTFGISLEYKY